MDPESRTAPAPLTAAAQSPPQKRFWYGWWILTASIFTNVLDSAFYFLGAGAFFLPVSKSFDVSKTAVSGVFSLSRLESGLLGPVQGWLVERFGGRRVMAVGVLMMGGGFMLIAVAPSLLWFYVFFVLFIAVGDNLGLGQPVYTTIVNWFIKRRTMALAIALCGSGIGGPLVPLISSSIEEFGWRKTAFVIGLIIWAVGLPMAAIMRFRPEDHGYQPDGLAPHATPASPAAAVASTENSFTIREALRLKVFWLMGIAFALRMLSSSGVPINLVPYLEEDVGFSTKVAATYLGLLGPVGIGGRLLFGFLGDRFPKRHMLFVSFALQAASLPVLATADHHWQMALFLGLFATGHAGAAPIMLAIRGDYFGRKHYATISGFMAMTMLAGTVLGPLVAAALDDLFDHGYSIAFVMYGGLTGAAALLIASLKQPRRPATGTPALP